jgi:predicted dinucleotide-binding enzyme
MMSMMLGGEGGQGQTRNTRLEDQRMHIMVSSLALGHPHQVVVKQPRIL